MADGGRFRLAHFSDVHVTHPPFDHPLGELRGKRLAGLLSYYGGRRKWRFPHVEPHLHTLLQDVEAQQPHHALCTGDITQASFDTEFSACAGVFGSRLLQPQRWSVIPGNHDRYVPWAVEQRLFENHFANLCEGAVFPAVKKIHPGVTLVMVDVARPCTFTDSSGWCGPEQRKKLEAILSDASLAKEYVVVALHYGLLRAGGERDKPTHRIRDDVELMAVLDAPHAHCDLVLHGHMHRPFSVRTARRLVFGAGSATDLHLACGYNVYDVDLERRSVVVNRRVWDEQRATYQAAQQPPPV